VDVDVDVDATWLICRTHPLIEFIHYGTAALPPIIVILLFNRRQRRWLLWFSPSICPMNNRVVFRAMSGRHNDWGFDSNMIRTWFVVWSSTIAPLFSTAPRKPTIWSRFHGVWLWQGQVGWIGSVVKYLISLETINTISYVYLGVKYFWKHYLVLLISNENFKTLSLLDIKYLSKSLLWFYNKLL